MTRVELAAALTDEVIYAALRKNTVTELRGVLINTLIAGTKSPQSAGDLLVAAADGFINHVRRCNSDDCSDCEVLLKHMGVAHDVWRKSQYQRVTQSVEAASAGKVTDIRRSAT